MRFVVCAQRAPVTFEATRSGVQARRGAGGMVGVVAPILQRLQGTVVAAARSEADRAVAQRVHDGYGLRLLNLPPGMYSAHYDVVCNQHFWFLFHHLYDLAHEPVFDTGFRAAWDAYDEVNRRFAVAAKDADVVFVQDYQLMRVGAHLRTMGFDRPILYFHHIPWVEPETLAILPEPIHRSLLEGMAAYDVVGFHCHRWADAFRACTDGSKVVVAPAPIDAEAVQARRRSRQTQEWVRRLQTILKGRRAIVRTERVELSKNVLRGLLAYEELCERGAADDTVFLALVYVSRPNVPAYRRYLHDCRNIAGRINTRFGSGRVVLSVRDEPARSFAGLHLADVLLVNPIFDGLNLVAKEGVIVNERHAPLVLSRNAGAAEELGAHALVVNPFDVAQTADALHQSLSMDASERATRSDGLRERILASTPQMWLNRQLDAAGVRL